jgi:phytoene synthase
MSDDLDRHLKTVDPDRWLATRFIADRERRHDVMALYAFDHELERVRSVTSQPMLGEIRLAWWREAVEEAFAGKIPRAHPTVQMLSAAIARRELPPDAFFAVIEARARDLDAAPLGEADALAYADAAAAPIMRLAARVLDPAADADLSSFARAWAVARLKVAGRLAPEVDAPRIVTAALAAAPRLSADAFPAVAHAALAAAYAGGRAPSALAKRLSLVRAVARGRL